MKKEHSRGKKRHFQLWILEMHLQNYKFKKKIVGFANASSRILQIHLMNFANAFSFFGNAFALILKIQFKFSTIKKFKIIMDFHNFFFALSQSLIVKVYFELKKL